MKLHEALSTSLDLKQTTDGNIRWRERHNRPDYFFTKIEILADNWQVRLPDGGVTDDYQFAVAAKVILERRAEASNTPNIIIQGGEAIVSEAWLATASREDIKQELMKQGVTFDENTKQRRCECGSEAIGGLKHSNWCPKHG